MPTLQVTEIKAFVPSKNFELSQQFYKDIGFTMASEGGGVAYFHFGNASFLLQDFCAESFAESFMMHLLVEDVEAWWNQVNESGVVAKYGVSLSKIELQPWRMRDSCLTDASGVLWGIRQNVKYRSYGAVPARHCSEIGPENGDSLVFYEYSFAEY